MIDWQEQVSRRARHARAVVEDALAICDEYPLATIGLRSRLAGARNDLKAVEGMTGADDRGLELAEDLLHERRQAGPADNRVSRALAAVDWVRKQIRGDR